MSAPEEFEAEYDYIVVGAGFGGLACLHRFREAGHRVLLLEAGSEVGGTWFWNRYPGARVDMESLEYSYGFSDELQQEYSWPRRYALQPHVEHYLNWVADRLQLRDDIRFDTQVTQARYDVSSNTWILSTADGTTLRSRACVMAVGFLSATHYPDIPGLDEFGGELVHTGAWPHEGVQLEGRRVGVIGAGATAVQLLPVIAETAGALTLFQRTPNYVFPMKDRPMPADYETYVKSRYPEVRKAEYDSGFGAVLRDMTLSWVPNEELPSLVEMDPWEREMSFEKYWRGDCWLMGFRYRDTLVDEEANNHVREFWVRKVKEVVQDQEVAEKLIPTYPLYTRRPCGGYGYYETFNRENVELVDALTDPIDKVSGSSVVLRSGAEHEVDVLICATGFDAGTGAMTRIDIKGLDGADLKSSWSKGATTYLGMMTDGFPNLFFINGMQSPSAFFSPPLLSDYQARWILRVMEAVHEAGHDAVEPLRGSSEAWVDHINAQVYATLLPRANSWWMGANIPGKPRQPVTHIGGFPDYAEWCEAAVNDLTKFRLHSSAIAASSATP